jgi:diguanylate cyclase (GGDEF)-like protein
MDRGAIENHPDAPGRTGLQVIAVAAICFAMIAGLGGGVAYWLCIPAALVAAARCRTHGGVAAATAVVMLAAALPTIEWTHGAGAPAVWAALLVPLASVGVVALTLERARREQAALRDVALTDPLTRIANRRRLLAQADYEVARHQRSGRRFAVVMLDLDGFKSLNDRFGHAAGDDLLRDVAAALQRAMRAQDTVARIGGDEFCVLAPETGAEGAEQLATRVAQAVAQVTAGVSTVRGSVGGAVFPDDAEDPAELMKIADAQLLAAKRRRSPARTRSGRRAA